MANKSFMLVGPGNLGKAVATGLLPKGYNLYKIAIHKDRKQEEYLEFGKAKTLAMPLATALTKLGDWPCYSPSFIVIAFSGDAINEYLLDGLFSLKRPVIICSTDYDQELVRNKALAFEVPVFMSENMVFGILDFWNRLDNLGILELGNLDVRAIESHQFSKKDLSGSVVQALVRMKKLGWYVCYDHVQANIHYKASSQEDGSYGCLTYYRTPKKQLEVMDVPKEHLDEHAFHSYFISVRGDMEVDEKDYLLGVYNSLLSLRDYSVPGTVYFDVELLDKGKMLKIVHNVYGRSIYSQSVEMAEKFLDNQAPGVYTGLDLIAFQQSECNSDTY